jgi:gamma-glutamyltranspeptidase/glutathione hydrolase
VVYPAVALAQDGFPLTERLAESLEGFVTGKGAEFPATVQAFSKNGQPYAEGEVFKQPDLARTLTRIMQDRRDGFYAGETARLLAEEMRRGGGIISERDLAIYQAKERTPVVGEYRGYQVVSMPPPSSGGVAVVEMLNILEGYDLRSLGHNSPAYLHHLAESMRRAFRDRARFLADQDFVDVPVHRLTSEGHAQALRAEIDPARASASSIEDVAAAAAAQSRESPETTHYSVVDADGMAVSVTYTLEQGFGTGITVAGAGFLLNNEMGDFNARPGLTTEAGLIGTQANLARPEQRMLSSMSPAILARDGQLVGVVGSPGGRTIINTVLQLILNRVDFELAPEEIVRAGRIHHQWLPDRIVAEEGAITDEQAAALEAMGHTVLVRGSQGRANSIFVDPRTRELVGVPDVRSPDSGAAGS